MKKISRLTALLLALIMLNSVAFATEEVIERDSFDLNDYVLMVAAAKDANEAVGKDAVTNQDNVPVHSDHNHLSGTKDTLNMGTIVKINSYETGWFGGAIWDSHWYGVYYEKDGETKTGYIQTKYLDVQEPAPEIGYTPWDGVSETITLTCSADAVAYEWQRGMVGEDGELVWETIEGANSAELMLEATPANLQHTYRCVPKNADGTPIAASEPVVLLSDELAQWISSNDAGISDDMLKLAVQATSLDSMMLVGDQLIHVRTGECFAVYDETTGELTDTRFGLVFARVEGDKIVPLVQPAESIQ